MLGHALLARGILRTLESGGLGALPEYFNCPFAAISAPTGRAANDIDLLHGNVGHCLDVSLAL